MFVSFLASPTCAPCEVGLFPILQMGKRRLGVRQRWALDYQAPRGLLVRQKCVAYGRWGQTGSRGTVGIRWMLLALLGGAASSILQTWETRTRRDTQLLGHRALGGSWAGL